MKIPMARLSQADEDRILADPGTRRLVFRILEIAANALITDPIDAAKDAEIAAEILKARAIRILERDLP